MTKDTKPYGRREFLVAGGLSAASALLPGAAFAQGAWEAEWSKLAAAARKEGTLNFAFAFGLGKAPRATLEAFEKSFGVKIEMQTFNAGALLAPKILKEQQAGVYVVDMIMVGGPAGMGLRDAGAVVPLRPVLFRPDVLDDKAWAGGFENGFNDKAKQFAFGALWEINSNWWINTELISPQEVTSTKDLFNPKLKGKIMFADVRAGATWVAATAMRLMYGEDMLKRVFVDLEPAFSRDNRQILEQLIRGQRALVTGVLDPVMPEFEAQGLTKNLRRIYMDDTNVVVTSHELWLPKNAPHPNAARLFANWLLSREGQSIYTKDTLTNSRRLDVPPTVPEKLPKPGVKYPYTLGAEATLGEITKTIDILTKLVQSK